MWNVSLAQLLSLGKWVRSKFFINNSYTVCVLLYYYVFYYWTLNIKSLHLSSFCSFRTLSYLITLSYTVPHPSFNSIVPFPPGKSPSQLDSGPIVPLTIRLYFVFSKSPSPLSFTFPRLHRCPFPTSTLSFFRPYLTYFTSLFLLIALSTRPRSRGSGTIC